MMQLKEILDAAVKLHGSDIYILPGSPVLVKVNGKMVRVTDNIVLPPDSDAFLQDAYVLASDRDIEHVRKTGDDDFSFSVKQLGRFRCNAYKQRGTLATVLRVVPFGLPDFKQLGIPEVVMNLAYMRRGMVLVTGPAGSGKSTTLACVINKINSELNNHIITLEDPIEFLHPHKNSIVSQREILHDTTNYGHALRAAMCQAPDVILLGEMRDYETIATALTAGETGHLVFSTLHTIGAAKTIDRVIDVFPANQQQQVRIQLSMVLQAVISQQLLPTVDGGMVAAFEVMIVDTAIRNMVREGKVHQMDNVIYAGAAQGMMTMDADILRLYKEGKVSKETALLYATNPEAMSKRM